MTNPAPINHKIPSFNCNKCSKTFTAKHNLDIHSRTVHKDLDRCSLCHHSVKNLVQHNTRYHAGVSKGRRQCQYCFRWYIRICMHKCSRRSHQSSYIPIACAPTRITEYPKPFQISSLIVSNNYLPGTPIISPQNSMSRSVSLLSLNYPYSTHRGSSFKLPSSQTESSRHWAHIDFLINKRVPFDPTKGSPRLVSTYPDGIDDTISISPDLILYNKGIASTSSPQGKFNIDLPDYDIPIPSVEPCDADHISAEEPTIAGCGLDWMTWGEFMSCNFNALEQEL